MINEKYNLIGQKFGKLTVLKFLTTTTKHQSRLWECKCDCGNVVIKSSGSLKAEDTTKHCGCEKRIQLKHGPRENLIGQKFNRLTVVDCAGVTKGREQYRWLCLCDCGKQIVVVGHALKSHNTKSCGCLKIEKLKQRDQTDDTLIRRLLNVYKRNSMRKNLSFELTLDQFKILINNKCHYCGIEPSKIYTRKDNAFETFILYNGIDRKDNFNGYSEDNSLTCCEICNRAKSNMSYDEFIKYINRLKRNTYV